MRRIHLLSLLLLINNLVATSPAQHAVITSKPRVVAPPKPKLTEQQKRGLVLLGQAETEATALQPDMRAYVEWQASIGYQKFDPMKSAKLLENAFTASSELSSTATGNCWTQNDESCRVKHWLQDKILEEMEKRSPDRALELSAGLEKDFQTAVETRLLSTYLQQKKLEKAKDMLDRVAGEDGYPFAEAANLMQAIPRSRATERAAIFSQALTNYRQVNTVLWVDEGDFAAMLLRCWRELPPEMALDAIDAILEKTRADSDSNKQAVTIATGHHGDIRFSSSYQLRVFELLPLLRELDSARADSLLREQANLQALTKQYPNGMFSIDRKFGNTPQDGTAPEVFAMQPVEDDGLARAEADYAQQYTYIQETVTREAKDALAFALSLPELTPDGLHHPRLNALFEVASGTGRKSPEVCRSALAEIRKLVDDNQPAQVTNTLLHAAELYQQLGDSDNAKSTLKQAAHSIEQAYKKDSDLSDPNQAFKGNWPSTQLWGRCLHLSARVAPELQDSIMSDIPDTEIRSVLKVMIANGLLGAEPPEMVIAEMHNGKRHYMMMR